MGVALNAYRVSIGSFAFILPNILQKISAKNRVSIHVLHISSRPQGLLVFLLVAFLSGLRILAGDIELNPGPQRKGASNVSSTESPFSLPESQLPTNLDILAELRSMRLDFSTKLVKLESLTASFDSRVRDIEQHVATTQSNMVALVDRITAIEYKFDTPDDLLSLGSMHHGSAPPVSLPITASESCQTIGNMNFSNFISEFKLREGKKCNVIVSGLCAQINRTMTLLST